MLYAEGRHLEAGFRYEAKERLRTADALPPYRSRGATAYAHEKADMFTRMADDCAREVREAHAEHRRRMLADPERCAIFKALQEPIKLERSRIDYGVVRIQYPHRHIDDAYSHIQSIRPLMRKQLAGLDKQKWERVLETMGF